MYTMIRVVCGLLFAFAICNPSFAQQTVVSLHDSNPTEDAVKARIAQIAAKNHLHSVWFYIEQNGAPRYDIALGNSLPDKPEPVGSISKSMTGIGIALLIQDHKISLQSTVGELLGNLFLRHKRHLQASLSKITVEQLLTHTAGLPTNKNTDPVNGITTNGGLLTLHKYPKPDDFDFLTANNLDKSTGSTEFLYSNISYLLLGIIIEEVSGQSYEQFCRSRIFDPLKISDASLIGGVYQPVSSYIGWELSRRDIAKIWGPVFNRNHPSLLSAETLDNTVYAPLGRPLDSGNIHYTTGVYVKHASGGDILYHGGEANTSLNGKSSPGDFSTWVEERLDGPFWVIAVSPIPKGADFKNTIKEFRSLVGDNE